MPALASVLAGCSHADDTFWVRRAGADLPVWRQGPSDAETLVLMTQGSGASGRFYDWLPAFDALEDQVAVVYWDLRGAGVSQGNPAADTLAFHELVDDLALVREAVDDRYAPETLVLAGHSLGGGVSLGYLTDPAHQDGVSGYVDVSGAADSEAAFDDVRDILLRVGRDAGRDDLVGFYEDVEDVPIDPERRRMHARFVLEGNALRGYDQEAVDAELQAFLLGQGATATVGGGFDVLGFAGNTASFVEGFDFRALAIEPDALATIDLPCLFVSGRYDLSVPPTASLRTRDRVAGRTSFVELEGGHWPMFDEPEAFSSAVLDFLDTLP